MSNYRRVFRAIGHEFQWVKRKTLNLCQDCAFHMPGPFADLCEASGESFDCEKEEYGAWEEINVGKQR